MRSLTRRTFGTLLMTALFLTAFVAVRFAQAADVVPVVVAPANTINLAWLANLGLAIAGASVAPVAGWIILWLSSNKRLNLSATNQAFIATVLGNAAVLGANKLDGIHITNAGVTLKSAAMTKAINYTVAAATNALKTQGYDPTTSSGQEHIANMVEVAITKKQDQSTLNLLSAPIQGLTTLAESAPSPTEQDAATAIHAAVATLDPAIRTQALVTAATAVPGIAKAIFSAMPANDEPVAPAAPVEPAAPAVEIPPAPVAPIAQTAVAG